MSSKSSPPPPNSSSQSPPPPPSSSSQSNSPPPPSTDNGNNNNGSGNDNSNNGDNNSNKSPPPPPSPSNKNSQHSPPPPPPPPPPPRHHKELSPPHKSSSSDDSQSGGHSSDVRTKTIIGGVVGAAALLLLVFIVCVVTCCRRKKKRKPHDQMLYYMDGGQAKRTNAYYSNGPSTNRMKPPPSEHRVDIPQSGSTGVSSEYRWSKTPPPPPPPQFSSSEYSSAGFSGPHKPAMPPPHPALALGFNKSTFTYGELATATGGFGKAYLLGEGGFGYVYKGVLPNGKEIAVKSLKSGSGQGEREFQAEVEIISRVHHRHLVSLVGYSIADNKRMLVYEFVPNGNLEHHLHGKGVAPMNWSLRIRTAIGSARGFAYLHEDCHPRIFHRDIKTSNILLDEHYEAKVADFGLAKLSSDTFTHVSTRIMGTFGYLAPEYASTGKLTDKSDIYSYGVMLLELITGKRPVDLNKDDETLVDWARPILMRAVEGGSYAELVDPQLENNYSHDEMLSMVACAAACIRHSARRRPKMSQIVHALEGNISLDHLNEGKPDHGMYSSGSDAESSYTDVKKFSKPVSSSQEFSGEHGHPAEYSSGDSHEFRPNRI